MIPWVPVTSSCRLYFNLSLNPAVIVVGQWCLHGVSVLLLVVGGVC